LISDSSPPLRPDVPPPGPGYAARVAIAVALVVLAYLVMQLLPVFLLVFGSIVVAAALRAASVPLRRWVGHSDRVALAVVVLLTVVVIGALIAFTGDRLAAELATLRGAVVKAAQTLRERLAQHPDGLALWEWAMQALGSVEWWRVAGLASGAVGAIGTTLLMLVLGVYLAANPSSYRHGLLRLLPLRHRPRVETALQAAGTGLSKWLHGQVIAMFAVGLLTAVGLAAIGMPLASLLGVIAGLLEFVPFFGTAVSASLIVLLAFAEGPQQAGQAALVCLSIQCLESYVLQPLIQRRVVALPPALGMIGVVAASLLFGPIGAVFATPLVVALRILVLRLYVHDLIEQGQAAEAR
jgi:predicted PurR-regulated permease PerM